MHLLPVDSCALFAAAGMAAPMTDSDAAGLIVTYLKSSGQTCWYNLAYLRRLIGTGAVLQGVSLNWPKNKVCSSAFAHSHRAHHAFKGLKGRPGLWIKLSCC